MASAALPSSVDALQALVLRQQSTIEQQAERLSFLEEWNRLLPQNLDREALRSS